MRKWLLLGVAVAMLYACDDSVQKTYWDDGKLKSELRFDNGKMNGECIWYSQDGRLMKKAHYKDDVLEGQCISWHANGKMASEEYYVNGVLDGEVKKWYDNGQLFQEGQYAKGMMDGQWFIFYPSGALAGKAEYKMGTGKQVCYEESGYKCLEVPYVDNLKQGREIYYNPNGKITKIVEYEKGKVVSEENDPQNDEE